MESGIGVTDGPWELPVYIVVSHVDPIDTVPVDWQEKF